MKIPNKLKSLCDEFAIQYEWVSGDQSLFAEIEDSHIDNFLKAIKDIDVELIGSQKDTNNKTIYWFRRPEDVNEQYEVEVLDDEEDDLYEKD
jgi:hypothetical protein